MPRVSRQQKESNRERIVAAASHGFKARGFDAFGIDELMKAAGMTHGGFYNHFESKEDLALEVLNQAFTASLDTVEAVVGAHPRSSRVALNAIIDSYLSTYHRDHPRGRLRVGCVGRRRGTRRDPSPRGVLARIAGYIVAFTDLLRDNATQTNVKLDPRRAREQAIAMFSQLVGAQLIARAVVRADPDLSDEVLTANGKALKRR